MKIKQTSRKRLIYIAALLIIIPLLKACQKQGKNSSDLQDFLQAEQSWRTARDTEMRGPESWLTIAGLFWLEEGDNTFGGGAGNDIILPEESVPESAGNLILKDSRIQVITPPETGLMQNGELITDRILKSDESSSPDILELGKLRLWIISRGGRLALRIRDLNAPEFRQYQGLEYFPPDPKFKFKAEFIPHSQPKTINLVTMVGIDAPFASPGRVSFRIDGQEYFLDALYKTPGTSQLFFIFGDETNEEETYGGGRFLDAPFDKDGRVDLNFNRATNPPCAFTAHATCPLPPDQNVLPIRIEAGEKIYQEIH